MSAASPIALKPILDAVLKDYLLPWSGDHGVAHWARVLENGVRLSAETGADPDVVALFAVLHDSCRVNEHADPGHGPRAAQFASSLRGEVFELEDDAFELLQLACAGHTCQKHHPNLTIQTCWDSDRLDLGRVGIEPDPYWLGTPPARRPETIRWANGRATLRAVPDFVKSVWGVDLAAGNSDSTRNFAPGARRVQIE